MNSRLKNFALCLCLVFAYSSSFGQNRVIDSLKNVLPTEPEDTNKVKTLNRLSDKLWRIGKYDSSMTCAKSAQTLAQKLEYKSGLAKAYITIGLICNAQSNYPKALQYDSMALDIARQIADTQNISNSLNSIGIVYYAQGNYPKTLEYYFNALGLKQHLGDKKNTAVILGNIGNVYDDQGNYKKALQYDSMAIAIDQQIGDTEGFARNLGNVGNVYYSLGNYPKTLEYYFKALAIQQKIGFKDIIAINLSNIGVIYFSEKDYANALEYDLKALNIYRGLGSKNGIAASFINISSIYTNQRNYKQAKIYLDSALLLSKNIGEKEDIEETYNGLSQLDSATGNHKAALADYKNYIIYRDSLVNEANTKKSVQTEMNFEFEQKQAMEKAEQDKKDAIAEQDRNKQKIIRNSFMGGFVLMLSLAFFIFRGYRQKQKANIVITQQKEEVEKQKTLVEHQKAIVEEKNKDILDSITYAKRLQDALLPPLSLITQCFTDSFVLYAPKDIVAGDFYWMEKVGDSILIAACDCTGHGVPGALVSVVCSNALNRTVKEFNIKEPGKILDKVRELVLETFEKSENNVQDGMDISLAAISYQPSANGSLKAQWSGAYNSLWYISNKELMEVGADKQPIGKTDKPLPFNTHNLTLKKGDTLYLFTDGYADQFGGPKGKKFKYKQLQDLLITSATRPLKEQKKILEETLNNWKGNLEQVDDILILGIRV